MSTKINTLKTKKPKEMLSLNNYIGTFSSGDRPSTWHAADAYSCSSSMIIWQKKAFKEDNEEDRRISELDQRGMDHVSAKFYKLRLISGKVLFQ